MTELDALIKCRNHWQWLMITGDWEKNHYDPSYDWLDYCACCEFSYNRLYDDNRDCSICPLAGIAWPIGQFACSEDHTLYMRWRTCNENWDRKYWANRMVYACNQAIERLL